MKFFLIHGTYGNPQENWFPWFKAEMEGKGHEVVIPEFPTPEGQSLEAWSKTFEEYIPQIDQDTILIGHSIGCLFIMNVLEEIKVQIKAAILVAGFYGELNIEEFDVLNRSFTIRKYDWMTIKAMTKEIIMLNSHDDPYLPTSEVIELSEKLGVDIKWFEGMGHFNKEANVENFPELVEIIEEL